MRCLALVAGVCYSVYSQSSFPQFAADGCYCLPQEMGLSHTVGVSIGILLSAMP